ncbi:MAG: haloacid dehalogenase [Planctomycetes bacterium GWF2_41_51]|nr:MAG: haloacid dehalogenase [Planctomycetes bacterium GWF2_41_51]HBG25627.1 haloacid dehalogenase [Phycisphaerales bacterium]
MKTQCPMNELIFDEHSLTRLDTAADGRFKAGMNGIKNIYATNDKKVQFIQYDDANIIAYVQSQMGYPAMYPLLPVKIEKPIKAILMDLDGTSVKSEEFWIWIIERTIAKLLSNPHFQLEQSDLPHVSGHSVSEHLKYCTQKYCPEKNVEQAREYYFDITRHEMRAILDGTGKTNAFKPVDGLKDFLYTLKNHKIKIGLVTSGLYEKAWPEIVAAFKELKMDDPNEFYDAIITAGFAIRKGQVGTLGELEPKPHPWLYAETARVGLGIDFSQRSHIIGIEDSGAGVVSIRLAGFAALGISDGNIEQSGTLGLCSGFCTNLEEVLDIVL